MQGKLWAFSGRLWTQSKHSKHPSMAQFTSTGVYCAFYEGIAVDALGGGR
jgi:hypothetical protein